MKLKVCGLTQPKNINDLLSLPIDLMGFIFYKPSPRYISNVIDFDYMRSIPKQIKKVGVFVNEPIYSILNTVAHYDLDIVQLHGNESANQCAELKPYVNIIKAFSVDDNFDFSRTEAYQNIVDYFLFDTKTQNYGGSGKQFNWQVLSHYKLNKPFFLSGGINENSVTDILNLNHPQLYGIDINSQFEVTPGIKDKNKINTFINHLQHENKL